MAVQIDAYIASNFPTSPLQGLGSEFVADGLQFGVDPRFLVGLGVAESSLGIHMVAGTNDVFGQLSNGNPISYDSIDSSIYSVSRAIGRPNGYYFGQGLTSSASIYGVYCSGSCSVGLNNLNTALTVLGGNPNNVRYPSGPF
jgi:hypothetical protein